MSKIQTVNIIEYAGDDLIGIHSFSETPEGNQDAEAWFKDVVKENGSSVSDDEMEAFLEDGYYEQGDYQLFLTHSS